MDFWNFWLKHLDCEFLRLYRDLLLLTYLLRRKRRLVKVDLGPDGLHNVELMVVDKETFSLKSGGHSLVPSLQLLMSSNVLLKILLHSSDVLVGDLSHVGNVNFVVPLAWSLKS